MNNFAINSNRGVNPFSQVGNGATLARPQQQDVGANPFASAAGPQNSSFAPSFGQQAAQAPAEAPQQDISALIAALAAKKGDKKDAKKEDGMGAILQALIAPMGKGDKAADTTEAAAAPEDDAAIDCPNGNCGECVDEDGDGECDTGCPDGSCGG